MLIFYMNCNLVEMFVDIYYELYFQAPQAPQASQAPQAQRAPQAPQAPPAPEQLAP